VTAETPTILATSGGYRPGRRTELEMTPLLLHTVELARVEGRRARLCQIGTANGDQRWFNARFAEAGQLAGLEVSHLNLFNMPPTDDIDAFVGRHDIVWVNGGSVANLLAVWRVHGLGDVLRRAWEAGIVLSGVSAGSICWHYGGSTDSFGPELRIVQDGLGLLPYGNGVHYDSEAARRPTIHRAVGEGTLPLTYCTDDGVGLVYRGTELVEAVADRTGAGAYRVERLASGEVVEESLPVRLLA